MPKSHSVQPKDHYLYARSFHSAAKTLATASQVGDSLFPEADAGAVVFVYRHALELFLKAIVLGEGGNFLETKPDPISVGKTHSLSWLAQFVCQIVTALKWEAQFTCEGIQSFADFKAIMEDMSATDPGSYLFRFPAVIAEQGPTGVREFARRMDALLDLLDATAGALAAEWDMRSEGPTEAYGNGRGFEPNVQ